MKKQLLIAMICVMSGVIYNIVGAAAHESGETSYVYVPGWVEVQWANCEGDDNVKHFKVGTSVADIRMMFSLFKKSPTYFITISINGDPKEDKYIVTEGDRGVATPGTIRRVGGSVVENICLFTGNIIEAYSPTQIKMKHDQDTLEGKYNEDRHAMLQDKKTFHEKSQLDMNTMRTLSQHDRDEMMRLLSWKRSFYAELELKIPQKLSDITTKDIQDAYNLVKAKYNSEKNKMGSDELLAKFEKIQTAYETLSDSDKRMAYDVSKMKGW